MHLLFALGVALWFSLFYIYHVGHIFHPEAVHKGHDGASVVQSSDVHVVNAWRVTSSDENSINLMSFSTSQKRCVMPNTIDSDGSTDNSTIPSGESTARDSGGHDRVSPAVPTLVSLGLFALVIVALMRIHEKLRGRRTPVMKTLPDHHVQPQLWDVTLTHAEDFGSREDASWEHVMPISAESVSMPSQGSSTKNLASTRSHPRDCGSEYETWYQTGGKARLAVAIAMPAPRQQRTPDGPSSIAATPLCLGLIEVSCR